jgi:outer membrane lipoprotein-sorting protein
MKQSRLFGTAWILSGILALVALAPAASLSADWTDVAKKLTGRCAKFESDVKDMTADMEMKATTPQGQVSMTMKTYVKGERFRGDIEFTEMPGAEGMPSGMAGMTMAVIGDGEQYWMVSSMMGKQQLPREEADKYATPWKCSEYVPQSGKIVGSETVNGRDCHVVIGMEETFEMAKIWLDKETLDLLKVETKQEGEEHTFMFFKDYRKVLGDIRYPYMSEIYQGEKLISTITVKTVEVNKGVADTLFDPDKVEVKGPNMQDMMKKMQEQQGKTE